MSGEPEHQETPPPGDDEQAAAAVHGVLEVAANGRARCRACGGTLSKGEWRLGEKAKNPFGEGDTTYWFHVACGAVRRPGVFLAALHDSPEVSDQAALERWTADARFGADHHRAARLTAVGVAPSGRARCRHCRELIAKAELRIELSMFNDGRFDPMGYLHPKCLTDYVGAPVPFRRFAGLLDALSPVETDQLAGHCSPA
jgi:hypothetical protein